MENTTSLRQNRMKLKDPGSAITHMFGAAAIIAGAAPLLIKSFSMQGSLHGISMVLFILGVFLLYSASSLYHAIDVSESVSLRLRKIDHMMIYVLIAGTYSPVCLIALHNTTGKVLFITIWAITFIGMFQALFFINCPKWISSLIYLAMGWLCIFSFPQINDALSLPALCWLLAGGIIYTAGAVIYALKFSIFNKKHKTFGSHEIFHLFCLAGTFCHYILMYFYVAKMPL